MVKKALRRLPQSLDDIYHETMLRISGAVETEKSLAFRVISWIVAAVCPFSVPELQHALVVSPEAIEPGEILDDIDSEAITESDWLVSVCAGLVAIERESNLIRLVHFTVQEYFDRTKDSWSPDADMDITQSCISYLLLRGFETPELQEYRREYGSFRFTMTMHLASDWERLAILHAKVHGSFCLLEYATNNWFHHASRCTEDKIADIIVRFFLQQSRFQVTLRLCLPTMGIFRQSYNLRA